MIENWKESEIGTLLKICYGKDQKNIEEKSGKYDIWGTGGVIGKTNTCLYSKPSVLIGRKGTIDKPIYLDVPFWTVDTLFYSEIFDVISPKLLYYYFNTINWRKYNEATGVPSLSAAAIESIKIIYPINPKEQKKIVDILECIDNSIESTQKAIEKYKLVKQGMMQDILTRGLDENGKLCPTYAEAPELYKSSKLGFIPKEWDEKSVLDVATISSGGTPNRGNALYWDGDIPWVTTGEVNFNTISDTNEKITQEGMNSSAAKLFEKGTILMAMYGQGVTRAKCAILGINATTNQACAAIRTFGINNMFLYHYLRFSYNSLRNLSNDGSQQNLNSVLIGSFPIIKPQNETEQQQIADRLTSIDNKIESEQTYLEKLQKIKQGLMQDLLTGKVRCKF